MQYKHNLSAHQGQPVKLIHDIVTDQKAASLQPVTKRVIQSRLAPDSLTKAHINDQILLGDEENSHVERSDFRDRISTTPPSSVFSKMRSVVYSCVHATQVDVQWFNTQSDRWELTQQIDFAKEYTAPNYDRIRNISSVINFTLNVQTLGNEPIRGQVDMSHLSRAPPGFNTSSLQDLSEYNHGTLRTNFALQGGVVVVNKPDRQTPMKDPIPFRAHTGDDAGQIMLKEQIPVKKCSRKITYSRSRDPALFDVTDTLFSVSNAADSLNYSTKFASINAFCSYYKVQVFLTGDGERSLSKLRVEIDNYHAGSNLPAYQDMVMTPRTFHEDEGDIGGLDSQYVTTAYAHFYTRQPPEAIRIVQVDEVGDHEGDMQVVISRHFPDTTEADESVRVLEFHDLPPDYHIQVVGMALTQFTTSWPVMKIFAGSPHVPTAPDFEYNIGVAMNVLSRNGVVGLYSAEEYRHLCAFLMNNQVDDVRFMAVEGSLLSTLYQAYQVGSRVYDMANTWVIPIAQSALQAGYSRYEEIADREGKHLFGALRPRISGVSMDKLDQDDLQPLADEDDWSVCEFMATHDSDSLETVESVESTDSNLSDETVRASSPPTFIVNHARNGPQPTYPGTAIGMLSNQTRVAEDEVIPTMEVQRVQVGAGVNPVSKFDVARIQMSPEGARFGMAGKFVDRRRCVGVTSASEPLVFDMALSNYAAAFNGHEFTKFGFMGPNRDGAIVKLNVYFSNVFLDGGEAGDSSLVTNGVHSLFNAEGQWFKGRVNAEYAGLTKLVATNSTFVATAARLLAHRMDAGDLQEFWVTNNAEVPVHGGSYGFCIQAILDGFPPNYIYSGHVDTSFGMLPSYEISNPEVKMKAGKNVVMKTQNARKAVRESNAVAEEGISKLVHWTAGPHPGRACIIDADYPIQQALLMERPKAQTVVANVDEAIKAQNVSMKKQLAESQRATQLATNLLVSGQKLETKAEVEARIQTFLDERAEGKKKKDKDLKPNKAMADYTQYSLDEAKSGVETHTKFFGGLIKLDGRLNLDIPRLTDCIKQLIPFQRAMLLAPQEDISPDSEECVKYAYMILKGAESELPSSAKSYLKDLVTPTGELKPIKNVQAARLTNELRDYLARAGQYDEAFFQVPGHIGKFMDLNMMLEYLDDVGEDSSADRDLLSGASRERMLKFVKGLVLRKGNATKKEIQLLYSKMKKLSAADVLRRLRSNPGPRMAPQLLDPQVDEESKSEVLIQTNRAGGPRLSLSEPSTVTGGEPGADRTDTDQAEQLNNLADIFTPGPGEQ